MCVGGEHVPEGQVKGQPPAKDLSDARILLDILGAKVNKL